MRTVMGNSFKRTCIQCPWPRSRPLSTHTSLETPGHSQASLAQSLVGTLLLSPGSWCAQGFICAQHLFVCSMLLVLSFFLHFSHSDRHEQLYPYFFVINIQLICNVVLVSAVWQSDSVMHKYTFFFTFFSITVYHMILNIVPCAIVGPCVYPSYV